MVANVAREAMTSKTLSGMKALRVVPMTKTMSKMTMVITGTPRAFLAIILGARFWRARPVSTLPAPKRSALMAETAAVMTTTLRAAAAHVTPRVEKIWTKGLSSPVMVRQGLIMRMTRMAST